MVSSEITGPMKVKFNVQSPCLGGTNLKFYACKLDRMLNMAAMLTNEPPSMKTNKVVSEQVRHKPACTVTEKSYKLEIFELSRRGIVLCE